MLVFAKNPRGVVYIDGYQVWGKETGQQPRDIPWELYQSCRDSLEDATMREGYLRGKFHKSFPPIAFTYSEVRYLPEKTINTICTLIVDGFDPSWSYKKKVDTIKTLLRS